MDSVFKKLFEKIPSTSLLPPLGILILLFIFIMISVPVSCTFILKLLPGLSDSLITNITIFACVITILIYLYNIVYIPKGKKHGINIFIMLIPDKLSNDNTIIRNRIVNKLSVQDKDNHHYFCPNVLARYLYNYVFSDNNRNKLLSKLYINYFYHRSKADIIICGNIAKDKKEGKDFYDITANLSTRDKNNPFLDTICRNFRTERFEIDTDDTINGFNSTIKVMLIYIKMANNLLNNTDLEPIDSLKDNFETFKNIKEYKENTPDNDFYENMLSSMKQIINWHFINISYDYTDLSLDEPFLNLCREFLSISPQNTDIAITLQYCEMKSLLNKSTTKKQLKNTAQTLIQLFDQCVDDKIENNCVVLANRAYLTLIQDKFSEATVLYTQLFEDKSTDSYKALSTEIYPFLYDTKEKKDNVQHEYASYAYALFHLKRTPWPDSHKIAIDILNELADKGSTKKLRDSAKKLLK